MKRSSLPVLLLLAGAAWTAGQAVLPDMGTAWSDRLAAVAADRPMQALATALFALAGVLLVAAAVVAGRADVSGRGSGLMRAGTVMLGLGGVWLAAGRGAFNLHMYQLTDPAIGREAAETVANADVGPGFLPLVLTLPALLLGPVVLAAGLLRARRAGALPWAALACWLLGIGAFVATEFTVKATEVAGIAVATVALVLLGRALSRPEEETAPAAVPGESVAVRG
ncbi:hypothetical protein [Candidatus Blastococcus massiliensis]|uniref:hypothetical protein n=1 Tax=Candidatus Blastococcus massiliensis TaxID=1470358 RepID=UPI00058E6EC2|nr:hypothetical protein [Candidatus Blastococcus massiliensis]